MVASLGPDVQLWGGGCKILGGGCRTCMWWRALAFAVILGYVSHVLFGGVYDLARERHHNECVGAVAA